MEHVEICLLTAEYLPTTEGIVVYYLHYYLHYFQLIAAILPDS